MSDCRKESMMGEIASIEHISVARLRAAAWAWRAVASRPTGLFGWMRPHGNMSAYDRIDEMVEEIARLRAASLTPERNET